LLPTSMRPRHAPRPGQRLRHRPVSPEQPTSTPAGRAGTRCARPRATSGRWLEISGTLQQGRGLQWLDGTNGTIKITQAPKETTEDAPIRIPMGPPPEVVFSAPTSEETDVRLATSGFGASRPKATNATLEGRAQNRRVELVKK